MTGRCPATYEGVLLLDRSGRSQIAVVVELHSRFVQLIGLPEDRKATTVRDAIAAKVTRLPEDMRRSLTWDRGKEMADHLQFTVDTGIPVYFCDRTPLGSGAPLKTPTGCSARTCLARWTSPS